MQALCLKNGRLAYQTDYPIPTPQPGEALIRVRLAGICATDLEMVKGYKGGFTGVLGHEFVGVVESAPDPAWHGRRVVGSINVGCGQCDICRSQGSEHCPRRRVLGILDKDGVFADYVTVPLQNLLAVPDAVADETAVFAEPLAAALRIREQAQIRPSAKTAVIGPGRLGLLGAGVKPGWGQCSDDWAQPGSLALPATLGLATGLAEEFAAGSFDFVVEATGNEAGLATALRVVRPLGTIILKSTFAGQTPLNLSEAVVNEITIIGSRCGPFAPRCACWRRPKSTSRPWSKRSTRCAKG
jgi:threonine dehydrogenase-like Zn-dependent dehydrogenase